MATVLPSNGEGGNTAGDIHWKAPVADYASLPASGNSDGDTRVALDTSDQWTWNGSAWVSPTAGAIALTNSQIFVGNASNVATSVAMSGDATIANTGALTIANSAITNVKVSASAAIAFSKMEALASARLIVGSGANVPTAVDVTGDVTISNTGVTTIGASKVTEAMQVLADNTTNDVSTTKHGYAPKAPNDATKYLDGTGAWTVPAGGGGGGLEDDPIVSTPNAGNVALSATPASITSLSLPAPSSGTDIYLMTMQVWDDISGVTATGGTRSSIYYCDDGGGPALASYAAGIQVPTLAAAVVGVNAALVSKTWYYSCTGAVTMTMYGSLNSAVTGTWNASIGSGIITAVKIKNNP